MLSLLLRLACFVLYGATICTTSIVHTKLPILLHGKNGYEDLSDIILDVANEAKDKWK